MALLRCRQPVEPVQLGLQAVMAPYLRLKGTTFPKQAKRLRGT